MKTTINATSTRFVFTIEGNIIQFISIYKDNAIKVVFINNNRAIKRMSDDDGKINEFDIVDIINP